MLWKMKAQGQVSFQGRIHNAPGLTVSCVEQTLKKESPANWLYLLKVKLDFLLSWSCQTRRYVLLIITIINFVFNLTDIFTSVPASYTCWPYMVGDVRLLHEKPGLWEHLPPHGASLLTML